MAALKYSSYGSISPVR